MIKYLILGVIFYVIYISFFKKSIISKPKTKRRERNDESVDTVVECFECKTYVSLNEATLVDGKYFCSRECVNDYNRS